METEIFSVGAAGRVVVEQMLMEEIVVADNVVGAVCQGTSLAVCTPFIYPIYCSYSTFISLCLHICLLLFGYDLTLSCSQYTC